VKSGGFETENPSLPPGYGRRYLAQSIVMPDENPYEAPIAADPEDSSPRQMDTGPTAPDSSGIAQYAQLGLRLLGVMFVIDGSAGLIGSAFHGAMQSSELQQSGYPPMPDPYTFAWAGQSIAYLVVGIYCVVGGRWVLENVFLPSSSPRGISNNHSDSRDE
jgi:hypothetical protein